MYNMEIFAYIMDREYLLCNQLFLAIVQLDSGEASDLEPAADPNNLSIHLH
jgi:hypothetical protein